MDFSAYGIAFAVRADLVGIGCSASGKTSRRRFVGAFMRSDFLISLLQFPDEPFVFVGKTKSG